MYRSRLAPIILFLVILSFIPKIENPVNINVGELILREEDFGKEILYQRFQTRMYGKDFKLMDYPIGEFGARVDVIFFERTGFMCSAAIEADLGDHKAASIVLPFKKLFRRRGSLQRNHLLLKLPSSIHLLLILLGSEKMS